MLRRCAAEGMLMATARQQKHSNLVRIMEAAGCSGAAHPSAGINAPSRGWTARPHNELLALKILSKIYYIEVRCLNVPYLFLPVSLCTSSAICASLACRASASFLNSSFFQLSKIYYIEVR